MKTMMQMLIQLQQLRRCSDRTIQNHHLTEGEKHPLSFRKRRLRDCLPADVVLHYDRLRKLEPELLECPEIFAMAVLTTTWRNLTPDRQQKLEKHFTKTQEKSWTRERITNVPSRRKVSPSANQK
jgi:hypothetical protein